MAGKGGDRFCMHIGWWPLRSASAFALFPVLYDSYQLLLPPNQHARSSRGAQAGEGMRDTHAALCVHVLTAESDMWTLMPPTCKRTDASILLCWPHTPGLQRAAPTCAASILLLLLLQAYCYVIPCQEAQQFLARTCRSGAHTSRAASILLRWPACTLPLIKFILQLHAAGYWSTTVPLPALPPALRVPAV